MIRLIKDLLHEVVYIFYNYIVCNIPIWGIRKILYQCGGMKIGKGSRILMKTRVDEPWKIKIGDYVYVNEYCLLDGRGGIDIGNNVTIAVYSKLITGYHSVDTHDFAYATESIRIGDYCAVFANCIVLGGAVLDRGCVMAAGSVVLRGQYKCYGIYAGNPAKYIRDRKNKDLVLDNAWRPFFR